MTERKTLTAEIMADLRVPADPQVRPDGRWMAASVGRNSRTGEHPDAAIWLADTSGVQPARQLTTGLANDTRPRWSPDGRRIAFLSDRKKRGTSQIQLLTLEGGEATPLTDEQGGVSNFHWLPGDRPRIAYLAVDARDPDEEERKKKDGDDAKVYGEFWPYARLVILDVETGEQRRLETGEQHVASLSPAPDGRRVAITLWDTPEIDHAMASSRLAVADMESETVTPVGEPGFHTNSIIWSRSGDTLYFYGRGGETAVSSNQLWSVDVNGDGVRQCLTEGFPACIRDLARPRSRDEIFVQVLEGAESTTYRLDPGDGSFEKLSHFRGDVQGISASDDGNTVGIIGSTPARPFDFHAGDPSGELRRVSNLHTELDEVELGPHEVITWERNGFTLDGVLIWPPGKSREDGPLPTAVSIHGGPYGRWANAFSYARPFAHWLAAHGYLVFLPNPRGGAGHGQTFAESVLNTVGNEDYLDIMAGVDLIVEQGLADPDRMGCGGWSQGGFMTAWIVGHTDRFKCGVMGAGVSDWGMMIATSDIPTYESLMGGGNPYASAGPHSFDAQSPVSYVHNASTPTLILHGEEDARVPVSQGIFFHRGLRRYGVPTELVIYPREPHGFEERAHVIDLHRRVAEWYQRWIPVEG